jgi:hypothetical protein
MAAHGVQLSNHGCSDAGIGQADILQTSRDIEEQLEVIDRCYFARENVMH